MISVIHYHYLMAAAIKHSVYDAFECVSLFALSAKCDVF